MPRSVTGGGDGAVRDEPKQTQTMNRHTFTTIAQVRAAFWEAHPNAERRTGPRGRTLPQNEQPTDTRCAFVDYVDHLHRSGDISDRLSENVTL